MNLADMSAAMGASPPSEGTDLGIADVAYDSREATAGSLFFCIDGRRFDGHQFAEEAVSRGSVALVASHPLDAGVPVLLVDDVRAAMNKVASPYFGAPSKRMQLFGVTGTNGKTTVCYMVEAMAAAAGGATGLIGTVKTMVAGKSQPGVRTTPESLDVQRLLAKMVSSGVTRCAMEVTSVGIVEGRIEGCWFDLVAFTNLSQDHLDYHGDMENYYVAKRALFDADRARLGLVNVDDAAGERLASETALKFMTFGIEGKADFAAKDVNMGPFGSSLRVLGPNLDLTLNIDLPGPFNVSNALCAAASAHLMGISDDAIAAGAGLGVVPGRFESIDEGQPFPVIVDYAHTPDSLANVLSAARALAVGRVIVVFGCGGDRDRAKRPLMGEAAGTGADLVIATSDNPRSEDPAAILSEIEQGLATTNPRDGYRVIVDRREAIQEAIASATTNDVVVIAGKGHETGQDAMGVTIVFDDRVVAAEILRSLK